MLNKAEQELLKNYLNIHMPALIRGDVALYDVFYQFTMTYWQKLSGSKFTRGFASSANTKSTFEYYFSNIAFPIFQNASEVDIKNSHQYVIEKAYLYHLAQYLNTKRRALLINFVNAQFKHIINYPFEKFNISINPLRRDLEEPAIKSSYDEENMRMCMLVNFYNFFCDRDLKIDILENFDFSFSLLINPKQVIDQVMQNLIADIETLTTEINNLKNLKHTERVEKYKSLSESILFEERSEIFKATHVSLYQFMRKIGLKFNSGYIESLKDFFTQIIFPFIVSQNTLFPYVSDISTAPAETMLSSTTSSSSSSSDIAYQEHSNALTTPTETTLSSTTLGGSSSPSLTHQRRKIDSRKHIVPEQLAISYAAFDRKLIHALSHNSELWFIRVDIAKVLEQHKSKLKFLIKQLHKGQKKSSDPDLHCIQEELRTLISQLHPALKPDLPLAITPAPLPNSNTDSNNDHSFNTSSLSSVPNSGSQLTLDSSSSEPGMTSFIMETNTSSHLPLGGSAVLPPLSIPLLPSSTVEEDPSHAHLTLSRTEARRDYTAMAADYRSETHIDLPATGTTQTHEQELHHSIATFTSLFVTSPPEDTTRDSSQKDDEASNTTSSHTKDSPRASF